jgi:hypothetical protein
MTVSASRPGPGASLTAAAWAAAVPLLFWRLVASGRLLPVAACRRSSPARSVLRKRQASSCHPCQQPRRTMSAQLSLHRHVLRKCGEVAFRQAFPVLLLLSFFSFFFFGGVKACPPFQGGLGFWCCVLSSFQLSYSPSHRTTPALFSRSSFFY